MKTTCAVALALASAGGASAFMAPSITGRAVAPKAAVRSTSNLKMIALDGLPGAIAPLGAWDPLGLADEIDEATFANYQSAELKHGRVAMVATLGMLVQENFHPFFPAPDVADIGPAIGHYQIINAYYPDFWVASLFLAGLIESKQLLTQYTALDSMTGVATVSSSATIGDLGFDPFNIVNDEEKFLESRNKEINNGRLAMFAILGMWAQELVNGKELLANLGQ